MDKTYLEGERFGFATTRDVKTTPRAIRYRDINQTLVLEDEHIVDEPIEEEPFDFQRDIVEEFFPDFLE